MTNETPTQAAPAATIERPPAIVLGDSDSAGYSALGNGAVVFSIPNRHISRFTGAKAADALNGLVTNDVLPLVAGRGLYGAALTPKGKMLADVAILGVDAETFLVETSQEAGAAWWSMIRKYVNPRLAQYKDESAALSAVGIYGPGAPALLATLAVGEPGDQAMAAAMTEGLQGWSDWAHASLALAGLPARLVRAPYLGTVPGFVILANAGQELEVTDHLLRGGALMGSPALWQLAQLEGARPVMGLDIDANTIPQEANLEDWGAISFEKGCYTGQETVARIHFRGHVNRHLRGIVSPTLLAPGATVHDETGKAVGEVRRAGVSPRMGPIAIGMVRREVAEGAEVAVDGVVGRVVRLPFGGR